MFLCAWAGTFAHDHSLAVGFVAFEDVLSVVTNTTVFAYKRSRNVKVKVNQIYLPDIVVSSQVVHHVTFCPETKPAFLGAFKGTGIDMNEHMRLQVLFF